ncbi:MAG: aminotransferase class V-fold PLP-dependent enzyme, partial [Candidatus Heimdallarchaeota archaeon]|nr:aminotransferase class V-fold PLP-dependent enzyme [Candidatus Heimdallarchaeota archaeon]MCK4878769.1 aminotransferase class V-fold PLP-dependent enzyme [Candidatus Heimdallarchaeota archaeon]
ASKEEVTFSPDVTHGSKLVAGMMKYEENSNVVCYWNDYVGQVYQALYLEKTRNIEYRPVQDRDNTINPEFFAEKIDKNTVLVLLSHVQWLTGSRANLEEISKIAHENEAYIVVDSIQSTGALVNDVKKWDVDFLTCGVAKWLLGPSQRGFFYMKKELINEFFPPFAGYYGTDPGSHDEPYWDVTKLEYQSSIEKFTDINPGEFLYWIASEGMQIILDYGIDKVQDRIFKLTDYLIEELIRLKGTKIVSPLTKETRSGIINLRVENNIEIVKKLKAKKILTSSRFGGIRISPHFYNTKDDIDTFVSTFASLI